MKFEKRSYTLKAKRKAERKQNQLKSDLTKEHKIPQSLEETLEKIEEVKKAVLRKKLFPKKTDNHKMWDLRNLVDFLMFLLLAVEVIS